MKIRYIALAMAIGFACAGCAGNGGTENAQATGSESPAATATAEQSATPAQETPAATEETTAPATTAPIEPPINPSYTPELLKMAPKTMPEFSTVDLEGKAYDKSLLAGSKLTMVYYWATYCPYCKDELPYMAEIAKDMPEGSQFVSVVMDIYGDEEEENATARQLVEDNGITFPLLKMDEAGALKEHAYDETKEKPFLKPTTVFYDENGEQVGDIMIGTFSKEEYEAGLRERLESLQ